MNSNEDSRRQFPVMILNYMRSQNLTDHIIPALLKESIVSRIFIVHGNPDTVFGVTGLIDGEIRQCDKIWHIGNFKKNTELRCFRRWDLIHTLRKEGVLHENYIFVQDDDIMFHYNEINKLSKALDENKGVLISASHGRNIVDNKYILNYIARKCDIVIGKSIFGRVDDICRAVEEIRNSSVPKDFIMYEDDITICYFILKDKQIKNKQHYSVPLKHTDLPSKGAVSGRKNHMERRNVTLSHLLDRCSL
jgi:hypothetical protein